MNQDQLDTNAVLPGLRGISGISARKDDDTDRLTGSQPSTPRFQLSLYSQDSSHQMIRPSFDLCVGQEECGIFSA